MRMHTPDGHRDFAAGEAFHWAPGHTPEALEDAGYVDLSPTSEFQPVIEHITSGPATEHDRTRMKFNELWIGAEGSRC